MTTGNKDLLTYTIAAFGTFIGLFVLQGLLATSMDIGWHADQQAAPMNPDLRSTRAAEKQALGAIDEAIGKVAAGERPAQTEPSSDVNALSGWVHGKHFAPAEPFAQGQPAAAPAAVEPAAAPTTDAPAPVEGAVAAPAPAAPAPAPHH